MINYRIELSLRCCDPGCCLGGGVTLYIILVTDLANISIKLIRLCLN